MYSGLISKIEKAKRYAQEPDRATLRQFALHFRGENGDHDLTYDVGRWTCTCSFFAGHQVCSHTMAVQQMLGAMIPAQEPSGARG